MWEVKTPQVTERKLWKCPFKPSGGLALTSPKGQKTGGLATTFSGGHLARACVSPTPQQKWWGDRDCLWVQCRGNESYKESLRERGVGRTLTTSPRLLALNASNTLTSSSAKCYWKGKMPNVFKSSPETSPTCHITLPDVHGRAQRPHFWRKKNKNFFVCFPLLFKERGRSWRLLGPFPRRPVFCKATSQQLPGTVLGEGLSFCHPCFNVLYSPFKSCQLLI